MKNFKKWQEQKERYLISAFRRHMFFYPSENKIKHFIFFGLVVDFMKQSLPKFQGFVSSGIFYKLLRSVRITYRIISSVHHQQRAFYSGSFFYRLNSGIVDNELISTIISTLTKTNKPISVKMGKDNYTVHKIDEDGRKIEYPEGILEILYYNKEIKIFTKAKRVVLIVLDEIDRFIYKSGDDTLYRLTKISDELESAKLCIIGISNDMKFTELLDPRVRSRLSDEKMVFPPYDAEQLKDILIQRANLAFEDGIISPNVISLCAAVEANTS